MATDSAPRQSGQADTERTDVESGARGGYQDLHKECLLAIEPTLTRVLN